MKQQANKTKPNQSNQTNHTKINEPVNQIKPALTNSNPLNRTISKTKPINKPK
jgi:hypothetical protein